MKLDASFASSFDKFSPEAFPEKTISTYAVYAARNEAEGCQLLLRADEAIEGLTCFCALEKKGKITPSVYLEKYVSNPTASGETVTNPDGLCPLDGERTFSLEAGKSQGLYLRFDVPKNAKAGDYRALAIVKKGTEVLFVGTVSLHIWQITFSEATACETAVGVYPSFLKPFWEGSEEEAYKAYYDYLLANRVCAYHLPYDVLDERADAYMSNDRVTSFCVPFADDDDTIRAYYQKLSSNPAWFAKAYFYPVDEPTTPELVEKLENACLRLEALFPGYRICVPFFTNITLPEDGKWQGRDQVDVMAEHVNLWCPKSYLYTDPADEKRIEGAWVVPVKNSSFAKRLKEEQAGGDTVWWYVCWEPGMPYANLFTDMEGFVHRFLFWQQKQEGVTGFLYWGAQYWKSVIENPWESMQTVPELSKTVSGDGSFLYPGKPMGYGNAVLGSLRLEAIRDGIEDYELLTMAEKTFGRAYVEERIGKLSRSVCEYEHDGEKMMALRREIAEDLEKKNAEKTHGFFGLFRKKGK